MSLKQRVLKSLRRLAWWTGILAAVAVMAWLALDISAGVTLRRSIAAWRDAGLAMNLREIAPPDVPPEENAAVILSRVIEFRDSPPSDYRLQDRELREAMQSLRALATEVFSRMEHSQASSEEAAALETTLRNSAIAFRLQVVREAVEYDRFDAYLKYEQGHDLLIPHVGGFRDLARLKHAEAVWHASQDRWPEAFDSLAVSLQLGELLSAEPVFISQLTRNAIRTMTFEHLEPFLRLYPGEAGPLDRLMELVSGLPSIELRGLFVVEGIASAQWFVEHLEKQTFRPSELAEIGDISNVPWIDTGVFRPMHKADFARMMDTNRKRLELLRSVGEDELRFETLRDWDEHREAELPWYAVVTRATFINGWRLLRTEETADAYLTLVRTALAANAYRSAEGEWPETIDHLVPRYLSEVPSDPFDNQPLRYNRTAGRAILYSVGPNRTDDGGVRIESPADDQPGDIVWVLEGDSPAN